MGRASQPVSSRTSRTAAASNASPGSTWPFGKVQSPPCRSRRTTAIRTLPRTRRRTIPPAASRSDGACCDPGSGRGASPVPGAAPSSAPASMAQRLRVAEPVEDFSDVGQRPAVVEVSTECPFVVHVVFGLGRRPLWSTARRVRRTVTSIESDDSRKPRMRAASGRRSTLTIIPTNSMQANLPMYTLSLTSSSSTYARRSSNARDRSPRRRASRAASGFFNVCVRSGTSTAGRFLVELRGLVMPALHRRRDAEVGQRPLQARRRALRAISLGERRDEGIVFLQPAGHQHRQSRRDELVEVRDVVVAAPAQLGHRLRGRCPPAPCSRCRGMPARSGSSGGPAPRIGRRAARTPPCRACACTDGRPR